MIVTCPECATRYDVADKAFSSGGRAVRCNHCGCEWYQIGPSGARAGEFEGAGARERVEASSDLTARAAAAARGRFDARDEERRLPLESDHRLQSDYPAESLRAERGEAQPSATALRAQEVGRRSRGGRRDLPAKTTSSGKNGARAGRQAGKRSLLGMLFFPLSGVALAGAAAAALYYGPSLQERPGAQLPLTPMDGIETASAKAPADRVQRTARDGLVFVEFKYDLVERAEGPALEVWGRIANNTKDEKLSPTIEIVSKDKAGKPLQRWLAQPEVESIGPGESARFSSRMMYPLEPVHDVDFFIAAR